MPALRRFAATALAAACALLLPPAAARAQFNRSYTNMYTGRTFNNPTSALLDTMILHAGQRQMMMTALRRQQGTKAGAPAAPPTPARTAQQVVSFKPAPAPVALRNVAAKLGRDDKEVTELADFFRAGMKAYEQEAAKDHHPNDLAEAMTFYVAVNYGVLHNGQMPNDKQTDGLYRALRDALASVSAIQQADDRQKQTVYEAFVSLGLFTLAGYQQGAHEQKPDTRDTFRKLAAMNLHDLLGLPADRLRLTADGTMQFLPEK